MITFDSCMPVSIYKHSRVYSQYTNKGLEYSILDPIYWIECSDGTTLLGDTLSAKYRIKYKVSEHPVKSFKYIYISKDKTAHRPRK